MSISATSVKELREKTNAGMMDCKKALEETQGDFEAAVEWLRKKGLASAAKKAGRIAAEGLIQAMVSGKTGALVEVNSETDFVARNDGFRDFVKIVVEHTLNTKSTNEEFANQHYFKNSSITMGEMLKEVIAKIGENVVVRRGLRYEVQGTGLVHAYIHGEGKIGVLLELGLSSSNLEQHPEARALAQDITLHIAAMNPMAISSSEIPSDVVAKEKEILRAKNIEQGKKPEMVDKIVEGQIRKFLSENCLLDQAFVKNPDIKMSEHLKNCSKSIGGEIQIRRFVRFELGEGIEKKQTDFAAEVAAQTKGH